MRVAALGRFDVAIAPDLLLAEVMRRGLTSRIADLQLELVAYRERRCDQWPVAVTAVQDLLPRIDELDGLLIGPGAVIAATPVVAGHHATDPAIPYPGGDWTSLIDAAHVAGVPVIWFAAEVGDDPAVWPASASSLLGELADRARLVSTPGGGLERLGVSGARRIPSLAFLAGDVPFGADHVREGPERLLIQSSPDLRRHEPALLEVWDDLRRRGWEVAGLAASSALGDAPNLFGDVGRPLDAVGIGADSSSLLRSLSTATALLATDANLMRAAVSLGARVWWAPELGELPRDVEPYVDAHAELRLIGRAPRFAAPARLAGSLAEDLGAHFDEVADALASSPTALAQQGPGADLVRAAFAEHRPGRELAEAAPAQSAPVAGQRRREELGSLRERVILEERAAEAAERKLARLRNRRSVRSALRAAAVAKPVFRAVRRYRRSGGPSSPPGRAEPDPRSSADDSGRPAVEERLLAALPPEPVLDEWPSVSILVLTHRGEEHLPRLLPALAGTEYPDLEVVVVDNASQDATVQILAEWDPPFPVQVLRNAENRSFSAATNQAARAASGDWLLLLNDDVEPLEPSWLRRLVAGAAVFGADLAGARLVYPVRPDVPGERGGDDLTLQHRGIHFEQWGEGVPRPRNLGTGEDPTAQADESRFVPAVTGACLLVERETYRTLGGLDDEYVFGLEDVDLCLQAWHAGRQVAYIHDAILWHHEFGTQRTLQTAEMTRRRTRNRRRFAAAWGPQLYREVLADRLRGDGVWTETDLHVGVTVTRADPRKGHGDWFTARELGTALERLGWRVTYLERVEDRWYDVPRGLDVVVSLLDAFDVRQLPGHVVTVAWIRNWTHRWVAHEWFDDYDLVFASSERSAKIVASRSSKQAQVMPLASNLGGEEPDAGPGETCDVLFVGSYWNVHRPVIDALAVLAEECDVRLHGHRWDRVPRLSALERGPLDYDDLEDAYRGARLVIDDTAGPTRPYHAVNSRVFDGLATGTLVLSDNPSGMNELFGDLDLPTWTTAEELVSLVRSLLSDPPLREALAEAGRERTIAEHTYDVRAQQLRDALLGWVAAERWSILVGAPNHNVAPKWGDTHYARAIQRQLEARGHPTRVHLLPEWEQPTTATSDVVLHLFGLSEYEPRPSQVNVLWNISHPEKMASSVAEGFDVVCTASRRFASELQERLGRDVHVLLQATDPRRFRHDPSGPAHTLLFVANSRKQRRRILEDLIPTPYELAIYGYGWTEDLVDPRYVVSDHVPNDLLNRYYSSAVVVLNDHWEDMRRYGFVSNRIFDALAAGTVVVSDHLPEVEELFDDVVVTYQQSADLDAQLTTILHDPHGRTARARRGRELIEGGHTFTERVDALLSFVGPASVDHVGRLPQLRAAIESSGARS